MEVEGRSNVVLNMHARLQISLPTRFLSLLHKASQCAFGDGMCRLLIRQFFSLFAQFKTTTKSHENYSIVQELCESRGGRPGLSVLTSLTVSVDVKLY